MLETIRAQVPGFDYSDFLKHLAAAEEAAPDAPPLRVAVLRTYTAEPIEPVLKLRLILEGYRPDIFFGGYNQYVQEILDPKGPLYQFSPDLVLLMLRVDEVMPDLMDDFPGAQPDEWESRVADKMGEICQLVEQLQQRSGAQVIVQNFSPPRRTYFGVHDAQHPAGQGYLIQKLNSELARVLAANSSAFVWDFDGLVREAGNERVYDPKMWYVSRNPYRQGFYPVLVEDLLRYVRSALGRVKKCVVLDLDNTLWGGVVGEDGLEGIRLGRTYPGNCYRDFQKELLKLYHRGILLAINSKNNEQDAFEVVDNHPDMVLRRHHFAAIRVNWRDKATNMRELARELNIGLDSFIMIDDNPAECELLRQECPECDVVLLPEKPHLIPAIPANLPGIENVRLTAEDRRKGEMYTAQARRREHESDFTSLDGFLQSLEIEVRIEAASHFSIPRIAQLTQKTNQMNMTTRRYTEAQIESFAGDSGMAVYGVSSRDRFGDDGIIGVVILDFRSDACRIDTLLLSCRVIGRGIEDFILAFVAEVCRQRGIEEVVGEFFPTRKNKPAEGFFERRGFQRTGETRYSLDLRTASIEYPPHIRLAAAEPAG